MPRKQQTRRPKPKRNGGLQSSRNNNPLNQLVDLESAQRAAQMPRIRDKIPMVVSRDPIWTTTGTISFGTITPSLSLDVIGGLSFHLDQLANSAAFVQIFDVYRIIEVQVNFVPINPSASQNPLYTVIDYDDATSITINAMTQYETLQITAGPHMTTRTFTPRTIINAVAPGGAFSMKAFQWLDVATPTTPYYGLKYGIPALSSGSATPVYQVSFRLVVQFRHTR